MEGRPPCFPFAGPLASGVHVRRAWRLEPGTDETGADGSPVQLPGVCQVPLQATVLQHRDQDPREKRVLRLRDATHARLVGSLITSQTRLLWKP